MKIINKKVVIGIVIAGAVLLIGGKIILGKTNSKPQGTMVYAAPAERGDISQTIKLSAVLEGTDSTEVASNLHYEVSKLLVQEGDRVTKGQLLAVLDSSELSRKVESSNGSLRLLELQQQDTLADRQRSYESAATALKNAQKEYDDTKFLFQAGEASQSEVDSAKDRLDSAQRALDAIPSENGKAVLSAAEKQTLQNAKLDASIQAEILEDCNIISPIDGTVTRVNTKVGRFADESETNEPMFIIENIDELQMKVFVSESDIGKVKVGQTATVTADILNGNSVEAEVVRISPTGEEKSGGTGGRVIPVYIRLKEQNENLIAGITAKATILVAEEKDALLIPIEALSELEDGTEAVYTVTVENAIHIVKVETGAEDDIYISVRGEGISEGTKVVLSPSLGLTEGMSVSVQ